MGKYRKSQEKLGGAYSFAAVILKPIVCAITKQDWVGGEKIPPTGGCVLAINHVSHADPITAAHLTLEYGRRSNYLTKAALFKNKAFGRFLRAAGQIPVDRASGGAGLQAAIEEVRNGRLVVVYVEGSITKDPTGWPMKGKSGAARIALATGCPVIPVGQWGAQELLPAYSTKPHLAPPRTTIRMRVGDPVDLADLAELEPTAKVINEATDRIMTAILGLVGEARGEEPPSELFDPTAHGISATGNPNAGKHRKKGQE